MDAQFKIRAQQEEWQRNLADLKEWEKSQKAKDQQQKRSSAAAESHLPELAPIRGSSSRDNGTSEHRPRELTPIRGSSYGNGATVIEELEPEPIVQSTKALKTDRGKENHAAMHTYDHSKAKWDSFNAEEAEAAPSSQPAKAAPSSKAADGFLKARETTRKPQQAPLPPVRQPPQADNSAEGHKNRGNELFRKAQYDKALEAYTRSIELQPGCVAHANRAMAYLKLGRYKEAEQDCTAALTLDALYLKAWQRRATAKRAQKQLPEAASDFEEALRLQPDSLSLRADRDACLEEARQAEQLTFSKASVPIPVTAPSKRPSAPPAPPPAAAHPSPASQRSAEPEPGIAESSSPAPRPVPPPIPAAIADSQPAASTRAPESPAAPGPRSPARPAQSPTSRAPAPPAASQHPASQDAGAPPGPVPPSPPRSPHPAAPEPMQGPTGPANPGTQTAVQEAPNAQDQPQPPATPQLAAPPLHPAASRALSAALPPGEAAPRGTPAAAPQPPATPPQTPSLDSTQATPTADALSQQVQTVAQSPNPSATRPAVLQPPAPGAPGGQLSLGQAPRDASSVPAQQPARPQPAQQLPAQDPPSGAQAVSSQPEPPPRPPLGGAPSPSAGGPADGLAAARTGQGRGAAPVIRLARQSGSGRVPSTATEFEAAWRGLASDLQGQGALLLSMQANRLPDILQHALTPALLEGMLRAALIAALLGGDFAGSGQLLAALTRVPRFGMTVLGLPARKKADLGRLWTAAAAVDSGAELGQLRQSFRV